MADLTITAASVVKGSSGSESIDSSRNSGETLTAGETVYLKSADSKWWKAEAVTSAEVAGSGAFGICLNSTEGAGQPVSVIKGGDVTLGAVLTATEVYVLSTVAGKICPLADLVSAEYLTILGYAASTSNLRMTSVAKATGIAKA